MRQITNDANLVAYCGLYCGACVAFLKEKCPGCRENTKAGWCRIRSCCGENKYRSCADCVDFKNVNECKKFDNAISKLFAFVFRSNRKACIEQIRSTGLEAHAGIMSRDIKRHSLPR